MVSRRHRLWSQAPSAVVLYKNPCYLCSLEKCHIYSIEDRDSTCRKHLMQSGASWVCPYFVRGLCAYKSTERVCALETRFVDQVEGYELLMKLQKAYKLYIQRLVTHRLPTRLRKKQKKAPEQVKYARAYLSLLKKVMQEIQPECACDYYSSNIDPALSLFSSTSVHLLRRIRNKELVTRSAFFYIWIKPAYFHSDIAASLGLKQHRKSLPLVNSTTTQFQEVKKQYVKRLGDSDDEAKSTEREDSCRDE